jgi:hypothetical protein
MYRFKKIKYEIPKFCRNIFSPAWNAKRTHRHGHAARLENTDWNFDSREGG